MFTISHNYRIIQIQRRRCYSQAHKIQVSDVVCCKYPAK